VPKKISIISLIIALGVWGGLAKAVFAQALVPYRIDLNSEQLEQTGLSLVEEAIQLARFQQFPLALARAKLAVQLAPKEARTWALLGSLYLQEESWDEGIDALETALALAPERPDLRFVLGRAHFQKEEYREAVKQIRAGLKIEPKSPGALFDLGNAYYKQEQWKKAIADTKRLLSLRRNSGPLLIILAWFDTKWEMWKWP
jgi:tetratricopeptide (TPR) repeat protein